MSTCTTRLLLVDDNPDVLLLLRLTIGFHPAFEVVGEAANGLEALEVAAATAPDVVILDREMPVAGGLEILPRLRRLCPDALIVLFTANADRRLSEAATLAGADAVRTKAGQSIDDLVAEIESLLLRPTDSTAPEMVQLRIGPVQSRSARLWVDNTRATLDALLARPEEIPAAVAPELLVVFQGFLDEWAAVARVDDEFRWAAAAPVATIEELVAAWAELDRLSDEAMDRLGCVWSPPGARPFFEALTLGVIAALQGSDALDPMTADLPDDWVRPAAD